MDIVFENATPELRRYLAEKCAQVMAAKLAGAEVDLDDREAVTTHLVRAGFSTPCVVAIRDQVVAIVRRASSELRGAACLVAIHLAGAVQLIEGVT